MNADEVVLYPEMNEIIAGLLADSGEPMYWYAAKYIRCLQAQLAASQRRADAAVEDMERLMSDVGLKNYVTCAYCALDDDDKCFAGNGKCKAKWRGDAEAALKGDSHE